MSISTSSLMILSIYYVKLKYLSSLLDCGLFTLTIAAAAN